jgi:antitoxin component YwqK of YwqJK toxin-antitoxin module
MTRYLLFVASLLLLTRCAIPAFIPQQRIYMDENERPVGMGKHYKSYLDVIFRQDGSRFVTCYLRGGQLVWKGTLSKSLHREGLHKIYNKDQKLWYQQEFKEDLQEGDLTSFYPSGKKKCVEHFHEDKSTGGTCLTEDGAPMPFTPFF